MAYARNSTGDLLKGVLLIFVIIGHVIGINEPAKEITLKSIIYLFHMPLFLAVSGYFFTAARGVVEESKRAWVRYILPWMIATSVYFFLLAITHHGLPFNFIDAIIAPWFHLWFVPALFFFSILLICVRSPIVSIGILAIPVVLKWFDIDALKLIGPVDARYVHYGIFFAIGHFVAKNKRNTPTRYLISIMLSSFLASVYIFPKLNSGVAVDAIRIALCFSVVGLLSKFNRFGARLENNTFSRESLAIYLYHPLLILVVREFEPKIGEVAYYIVSLFACIFLLPLGIIFLRKWEVFGYLFGRLPLQSQKREFNFAENARGAEGR